MPQITPHLWLDTEAEEAARFWTDVFPDSRVTDVTTIRDTPSGDCPIVSFELMGRPFQAISAGPLFTFNPSVSFAVSLDTVAEVDATWDRLLDGGTVLMPLDTYPFSPRYGWVQDRYGLSWQLTVGEATGAAVRIIPSLLFVGDVCGRAEEAAAFYTSVFPNSAMGDVMHYGPDAAPDAEGTAQYLTFELAGQPFAAMDSAQDHDFAFNEAISLMVGCDTQEQIDHYWDALSADPTAEQCGWLKDRYGLSWQVVPTSLDKMLRTSSEEQLARVTQAFLEMKKFDLDELERAHEGGPA